MKQKYYYIYKITILRGKYKGFYYYGQRTSKCYPTEDTYKGSGTKLNLIYKTCFNNKPVKDIDYSKTIVKLYKTAYDLNQAEIDIIDKHLGKHKCLNLVRGGLYNVSSKITSHELYEDKSYINEKLVNTDLTEEKHKSNILYTGLYIDIIDGEIVIKKH